MAMKSYRVPPEAFGKRDRYLVRGFYIVALLAFGYAGLVIWRAEEVSYNTRLLATWLVGVVSAIGLIGGTVLGRRHALREEMLSLECLLDEDRLTLKRKGWPDVVLDRAAIGKIAEMPGQRLVVKSLDEKIGCAVPSQLAGYEELKAELLRNGELVPWKPPPFQLRSLRHWGLVLVWVMALRVSDLRLAVALAFVAFLWQCRVMYELWKLVKQAGSPKARPLGWMLFAVGALLAAGLVLSLWSRF